MNRLVFPAPRRSLSWFSVLLVAGLAACAETPVRQEAAPAERASSAGKLVFQTGFEGSTAVAPAELLGRKADGFEAEPLVGRDDTLPLKSDLSRDLPSGARFFIEYTGGDASQRFGRVVPDPTRAGNHVLQMWIADGWSADSGQRKSRVQTSLYGIQPGLKEFYSEVRLYLHPDFRVLERYPHRITWLTLGEYWNNEWWVKTEPYGFRITLGIGKPTAAPAPLTFILHAEDAGFKEIWKGKNTQTLVPIGTWFLLETYFKEGNADTGRFMVAITPEGGKREVVYDIKGYTHNTRDPAPNGMTGFNPLKLYTQPDIVRYVRTHGDSKALQVYWDDFRLWQNKRPAP